MKIIKRLKAWFARTVLVKKPVFTQPEAPLKVFKETPVFEDTPEVEPEADYNDYNEHDFYKGDRFWYTNKRGVRKEFLVAVEKLYGVYPMKGTYTLEVMYPNDPTPRTTYKRSFCPESIEERGAQVS